MGTIKIKNAEGNWVKLPNYGIQNFPEAPVDNKVYGRKNASWVEIESNSVFILPSDLSNLTEGSTSDEISDAIGGENGFDAICNAIVENKTICIKTTVEEIYEFYYTIVSAMVIPLDKISLLGVKGFVLNTNEYKITIALENGVFTFYKEVINGFNIQNDGTNIPYLQSETSSGNPEIKALTTMQFNEKNCLKITYKYVKDGDYNTHEKVENFLLLCDAIKQDVKQHSYKVFTSLYFGLLSGMTVYLDIWDDEWGNKSTIVIPTVYHENLEGENGSYGTYGQFFLFTCHLNGRIYTVKIAEDSSGQFSMEANDVEEPTATNESAGLMSAADKSRLDEAIVFKEITVATSLSNLPITNYSIKVTLSSASALSFISTPYEGWECMIDIKNAGSSDITQALPNATGWQCDETSITIVTGKIASISVRYVHGTYVVLSNGN